MAAEARKTLTVQQALSHGFALQTAGRRDEAEAVYRRILETVPNQPDALHLLGVARRQSGNPEEAIELIQQAIAANPKNPTYVSNLGTAYEAAGREEDALAAYRRAAKMKPDFAESFHKLGMLLHRMEKRPEAAEALTRAVVLKPDAAEWLVTLGKVLSEMKRFDMAVVPLRRAIALKPDLAEAHYRLGGALYALGKAEEAMAAHRRSIELAPNNDSPHFALASIFLDQGKHEALIEECDRCLALDPGNRRVISSKIVALQEMGRREEARALLGLDNLIRPFEFPAPEGYAGVAEFNAALADEVTHHPSLVFEKSGHATKFGGHTANILVNPTPAVAALEQNMRRAVETYMRELNLEPGHPFVDGRPDEWRLQSWAVVMDVKGHQVPHIHPAAWLSGVYYVSIPPQPKGAAEHAGWIEFGRPQENMPLKAEPEVKLFEPKEGLMFLFPGYLYHMTIPIETTEQRISIAFDVISEKNLKLVPF